MNKNQNIFHLFLLIFTAFIWGNAFVAQSVGADYVGPFTFLAIRTWMALVLLIPFMWAQYKKVHLECEFSLAPDGLYVNNFGIFYETCSAVKICCKIFETINRCRYR